MSVEEKVQSVFEGMGNAITGTVDSVLHPVDSVKAILAALRSPKDTAVAVAKQLSQDFKEDPTRTLVENLLPIPGPNSLKPRKIVVPEKLALKHELKALRAAKSIYAKAPNRDVAVQEWLQKTHDGWYPGPDDVFRKDIGEVRANPKAFEADYGAEIPLPEAIVHPDLWERMRQNMSRSGRTDHPVFSRSLPEDDVGGSYWRGVPESHYWPDTTVEVGGKNLGTFENTLNHELQHMIQDFGGLKDPYVGATVTKGLDKYFTNPGEIEARVAGLRAVMTPTELKRHSFPAMYGRESELIHGLKDRGETLRGGTLWEHTKDGYPQSPDIDELLSRIEW